MAERTEAPTGRRLSEARKRGQVARSHELNTVAAMLAGAVLLRGPGIALAHDLQTLLRDTVTTLPTGDLTGAWLQQEAIAVVLRVAPDVAMVIGGLAATGLVVSVAQTGLLWASDRLKPDLSRLNPLAGLQRLFSGRGLVELARAALKLGVVGWVAYSYLQGQLGTVLTLGQMDLRSAVSQWGLLAYNLGLRVAAAYLVLAFADYAYQRWSLNRSLRMTKQEVKEDMRASEGDPLLRGRVRAQQRRIARQRMLTRVPQADVVITNPTHFAVALQYDRARMTAPRLVAKGASLVAQRIKDVAREHGIAIVENPPLARAIYRSVEIEHEVPPDLYVAVAEVLAFVYNLKARRPRPVVQ